MENMKYRDLWEIHQGIFVPFRPEYNNFNPYQRKAKIAADLLVEHFSCEGVFEEIGQIPATGFLENFVALNDQQEIPTNRKTETAVPGFFAGGDCTDQIHKQVIVAAGEGAICALEAHEFILRH